MDKRKTLEELSAECRAWKEEGKRIVWTNGCFDLFHAGHVRALEAARSQGDVLVVGMNSDRSVHELKGAGRPLLPESDRAAMLSALEPVTRVLVFDGKRCVRELAELRPDIWTKSGDYTEDSLDPDERRTVLDGGGKIVITPLVPGMSTTLLVKKIRRMDPEKIVSAACSFVRDGRGRLLMVATRYADGVKWGLPCGGHHHGESLPDTAVRETLEETGVAVETVGHMGVIERIEPELGLHLNLHLFESRPVNPPDLERERFTPKPGEPIEDVAWFTSERMRAEPHLVMGRRLWLEYGYGDVAAWPPFILMRKGEE